MTKRYFSAYCEGMMRWVTSPDVRESVCSRVCGLTDEGSVTRSETSGSAIERMSASVA